MPIPPNDALGRRSRRHPAYERHLTESPHDHAARRRYAAWAERNGDPAYARALRYMVDRGAVPRIDNYMEYDARRQYPCWVIARAGGYYDSQIDRDMFDQLRALMPSPVGGWENMKRGDTLCFKNNDFVAFRSLRMFTGYLAHALEALNPTPAPAARTGPPPEPTVPF